MRTESEQQLAFFFEAISLISGLIILFQSNNDHIRNLPNELDTKTLVDLKENIFYADGGFCVGFSCVKKVSFFTQIGLYGVVIEWTRVMIQTQRKSVSLLVE